MRKKRELPEVEPVKLKPIFGIRPGVVILSGLIAVILLVFFLLFMLPGIVNGGKYVSFDSGLTNVGVYLDGAYLGSTEGSRYFIESGKHDVRYVKNSITIGEEEIDISHPIFFTLIFHRGEDIEIEYTSSDELVKSINDIFLKDVSTWSKVTTFSTPTTLPPLFSNYAKDITELNVSLDKDIWTKAIAHISSREMYDDYLSACSLLNISPAIEADIFTADESPVYNNTHEVTMPDGKDDSFFHYPSATFEMGSYQGDKYPLINEKRIEVSVSDFAISSRPVSEYEYALFVRENPKWALSNKENLISEGLVDENYLNGVSLSTGYVSSRPIRNISYYAAKAYITWLSEKDGVQYRLPSEAEWSYAAYSVQDKSYAASLNWADVDTSTPQMMMGGVWEYTSSEYVPLNRVLGYDGYSVENDDVIVKGGSYLNAGDGITPDTIGMIGKSTCSDYVGFRIAK